jgi:hypothetical protein
MKGGDIGWWGGRGFYMVIFLVDSRYF